MKSSRFLHLAVPALLTSALLLAGCGGPSNEDSTGVVTGATSSLHIISCSLGCSGPIDGTKSCTISDVFQNQTLTIEFNRPVDPNSVSLSSVRVTNFATGDVPPALVRVDPQNPRRVTYRPTIAIDDFGQYVPGFEAGEAYRVFVRGSGSGARIRATDGSPNITTLECFVVATKGLLDLQPGAPQASVFVDVLDGAGGSATSFLADGSVDVPLASRVRILFDEIMDAATLIDVVNGTSPAVRVRFDEDGDTATPNDQVALPGTFAIDFDEVAGTTELLFLPNPSLPSAGTGAELHRVVVDVLTTARDLAGDALTEPVRAVFTPQALPIPPVSLVETFEDFVPIAFAASSAVPEPLAILPGGSLRGRVLPGIAGGSGRLGDLVVRGGQTVVLGTGPDLVSRFGARLETGAVDDQGFATLEPDEIAAYHVRTQVLDNYTTDGNAPGAAAIEVADGLFEFASLVVEPGGVLSFEGENPPRLFVRGEVLVAGTIDVSGRSAPEHFSTAGFGGSVGGTRLGGGGGGDGADRPDQPAGSQMLPTQGPSFRGFDHAPGAVVVADGAAGGGRAGGSEGGGGGGVRWPPVFPGPFVVNMGTLVNSSYLNLLCAAVEVGAPGAGGTYATVGSVGTYSTPAPAFGIPPAPPVAPVSPSVRTVDTLDLDPEVGGVLEGGAGGGGGGAGIQGTTTNGVAANNCIPSGAFPIKQITGYLDASGAAGGSGGGALALQSGRALAISGLLDASGGSGGSMPLCQPANDGCWAAPGGGGSGGALLLQAPRLTLSGAGASLDVSGGLGGVNGNTLSRGGNGGVGVVEVRTSEPIAEAAVLAELLPSLGGLGAPAVHDVLEIATFVPPAAGPGVLSGFTTCWIVPEAGLFGYDFAQDDVSDPDPAQWRFAWNLKVELDTGEVVDWRGDSGSITDEFDVDFATLVGNDLGSSPLVVRFQGVRANGPIQQPCTFDATAPLGVAEPDSITPWVESIGELDDYWPTVAAPEVADARRPNAFRVQFVFDPTAPYAERIVSVVQLAVEVQPR
jgi:hypothetical protein